MKRLAAFGRALLGTGHGRVLPAILLIAAAAALLNSELTPLATLRNAQFDRYQRQMPRPRDSEPVVIVEINSQSLSEFGQWPWSRALIAQLADRILAGQPLALGFDIIFAEADRYSPESLRQQLPDLAAPALQHLPEPDVRLARSLASGPCVLAVAGLTRDMPGSRQPRQPLHMVIGSDPNELAINRYTSALTSRPVLEDSARGEGFINERFDTLDANSERGILRQVPTLAMIGQQPFLPLSLEMVRLALGDGGQVTPEVGKRGMQAIRIGDYRLPTQANGDLLIHFGKASSHYYLAAADVLRGNVPPEAFKSRFVIIGFNSVALQDRIITPLGDSVPGVDIHAQIIESLLAGDALQRPYWMPRVELATLLLGGLLLILAVPVLRPRFAIVSFVALSGCIVGAGYFAFRHGLWLFDGPSLVLLLSPVFMVLLANTLIEADAKRRQAEAALQLSREAAARTAGELDAARRIQMGLLPDPQALFASETRFSLAALLEPARAVGGDYYDCFMLDADRLCFAIGDVSGKGIPASLFMAISKTLSGTLTRREPDLGQAFRAVELELNRENPEYLFVTAFVGILRLSDGQLDFVCAGHDAPMLLRGGELTRLATEACAGPPLCALGDYPYQADQTRLQPGDRLCLFTDGVTEAGNGNALYGSERLATRLREHRNLALPELLKALRDDVRSFESGQPPADDLTLLLLHYNGPLLNAG